MTEDEKQEKAASLLVQICLNKGYYISVNDGEQWVVTRSRAFDEIIGALGTTDGDFLRLYDGLFNQGAIFDAYRTKGWFELIYGNNPDELVSDYLANDVCEEIWQEWQNQLAKEGLANDSTPA